MGPIAGACPERVPPALAHRLRAQVLHMSAGEWVERSAAWTSHALCLQLPAGEWAKDWFGWTRNNYDKLGHFAQGFVPAILAREILMRTSPLRDRGDGRASRWLPFLAVSVCLAFSAFYELIEWWVALLSDEAADAFLGRVQRTLRRSGGFCAL